MPNFFLHQQLDCFIQRLSNWFSYFFFFPVPQYQDLLHVPNSAPISASGGGGNSNKPKIYSENSFIIDEQLAEDECLCEVCCDLIGGNNLNEINEALSCKHKICANCWKLHLATKCQQANGSQVSFSKKIVYDLHLKNCKDLGRLIDNFYCGYKVWKSSIFPASAVILREINFG